MNPGVYVEELVHRMRAVRDQLSDLEVKVNDPDADAREMAFGALQLATMSGELDCLSDDLALIAEGEKYVEDDVHD